MEPQEINPPSFSPQVTPLPTQPPPTEITAKKSRLGLAVVVVLLLLASGASAYVYKFQPGLIDQIPILGKILNPVPTPTEATAKMFSALSNVKTMNSDMTLTISTNLPDNLPLPGVSASSSRATLTLKESGETDITDINNLRNSLEFNLKGEINSPGQQMMISFDGNLIQLGLGGVSYVKINQLPSIIPLPETSGIVGTWIKIDPSAMGSNSPMIPKITLSSQDLQTLRENLLGTEPVQLGTFIGTATIANKPTYNYTLVLSKEGLKKFIDVTNDFFQKHQNLFGRNLTDSEKTSLQQQLASFKQQIDGATFPELKIWLGQDDFLPYKIVLDETSIGLPQELNTPSGQTIVPKISFTIQYSNFNQPVQIQEPAGAKPLIEVIGTMMTKTTNQAKKAPVTPVKLKP